LIAPPFFAKYTPGWTKATHIRLSGCPNFREDSAVADP
jgi:hypothetical protein